MLLRTASTPILNSLTPNSSTLSSSSSSFSSLSSLFSDQIKSITLTTTSYCTTNSATRNMFRTSSESDLRRPNHHSFGSGRRMMTNSDLGLREKVVVDEAEENGFGSSDGGGCGGSDGGPLFWYTNYNYNYNYNNSNNINDNYNYNSDNHSKKINIRINDDDKNGVDVYYVKMIEANPGNSLLLGNYAKFLKEVQGDYMKAEEYCGRAILANPDDPNMLALYADLIWQTQRDSSKAETYFDQAVKAAPDDCYVLGSYAHFLWDAEDEDEKYDMKPSNNGALPMTFHGVSPSPPPLAAVS